MSSTNEFVTVAFEEEQYCRTKKGLAQWDREKTLRVYGISTDDTVQIHFSLAENYGEAVSVEAAISNGAIEASIPPFIFEKNTSYSQRVYYAYAFIYLLNGESAETVRKIIFEIETRPKPEDYVYYPEDVKTWSKKVNLPLDEAGNPDNGTAGQFAVSDGQGGITWLTVENESETSGDAADVAYDNTNSGLDADNAQEAIDKLSEEIADQVTSVNGKTPENGAVTIHANDIMVTVTDPIAETEDEMNLGENFSELSSVLLAFIDPVYAEFFEIAIGAPVIGDVTNAIISDENNTLTLYEYFQLIVQMFTSLSQETTSELAKKVGFSNVIDNLTTASPTSPLSANQGKVLKGLIDKIKVPTKTSELTNDSGFITANEVPDMDLSAYSTTAQMQAYVQEQISAIENGNGVAY